MMRKIFSRKALPLAVLGFLAMGNASAQSIVASETEAFINQQNHGSTVVFTNTAPATIGAFDFELTYDPASLTIAEADITTSNGGTVCSINNPGTILCFANPLVGLTLVDSITINLPFDIGAAVGVEPLTFTDSNVFDNGGASVVLVPDDGQITVSAAPPDVVLAFSPDPNVVFPGGVSGTNTVADIDVTVGSGAVGTGTIDNCVLGGANPAAFSIVSGSATVPPDDTLDLQVTLANSALSATLTCELDDASAATSKVFNLSAPAGTPVPAPEYSSSPAAGSAITCNGPAGSQQFVQLTISNTGFAGAGSELDYTCVVAGAGFTLESGGAASVVVGSSSIETFGCTVPAEDAPAAEGTVTCTSNDPANSPAVYDLSSVAATALPPVPQPNVVPASSMWSQLSLIGLLAALGLLVVGIRRKG